MTLYKWITGGYIPAGYNPMYNWDSGAHLGSGVTGSHIFISNYRGTKVLFRGQPHLGFLTCWTFEKWRTPKFYPDIFLVDVYF